MTLSAQAFTRTTGCRVYAAAILFAAILLVAILPTAANVYRRVRSSHAPTLLSTDINDWRAYEGEWSSMGGTLTDGRGGRGDKLIAGNPTLNDFVLSTRLRFNTSRDLEFGDAGLILRASNVSLGTDSMYGYYAGIRPGTQTVKFGRMEDDYTDLAVAELNEPVRIGVWYRLIVEAHECHFHVRVMNDEDHVMGDLDETDAGCVMRSGRVGLRAYSMMVSWSDLALQPLA